MAQFNFVASKLVAVTSNVTFAKCYGLLCSIDVTATVTDADGDVPSVPLQKGYNPISCTKVQFASGSIFALYERY